MIKLDLKDRKILYELNDNSRQSYSKIAKKVGLSKDTVQYRVNKLIKNGVITRFYTTIDSFKLGYTSIRFYLVFQNTTPEIREEIINYFSNLDQIFNCASIEGRYDLVVNLWIKNQDELYQIWETFLKKYKKYIQKEVFTTYIESNEFRFSYILKDQYLPSDRKKTNIIKATGKTIVIDNIDRNILKLLAVNTRIPIKDISDNLNSSVTTISQRIKNLEKIGLIVGYKVGINLNKIGYTRFKVDIFLNDYSMKTKIINYVKNNPHLTWVSKSIGVSDLEFEFDVQNLEKLYEILQDLTLKYPDAIRNYSYFYIVNRHRLKLIPYN